MTKAPAIKSGLLGRQTIILSYRSISRESWADDGLLLTIADAQTTSVSLMHPAHKLTMISIEARRGSISITSAHLE